MQRPATSSMTLCSLVVVRPQPPDEYTAEVVGIPEIRSTAASREEAIQEVQRLLKQWQDSGQLVLVEVQLNKSLECGRPARDPNDPLEKEFLEDLARFRQEDLERTLREYDAECSDSSSTPTT